MQIKNLFLITLLSVLVWGCTPMAKLQVVTFPADGVVRVDETGSMAKHGGDLLLEAGEYTLVSQKDGYYPGRLKVTSDGWTPQRVTVPLGEKKPVLSLLTVVTSPAGGVVQVVETGRDIKDGGSVKLSAGRYTLRVSKENYRDNTVKVDLDGEHPQTVTVPLGEGYAALTVTAKPRDAMAVIDAMPPLSLPLSREMNSGVHRVKISKNGYFSASKTFDVRPGVELALAFELKKIPTTGKVMLRTKPAGGRIYFREKEIGVGESDLGWLKFGTYKVSGVKNIDKLNRLTGSKTFNIQKSKKYEVSLDLDQRQRFYEDEWLALDLAVSREKARYLGQRVANPVVLNLSLDQKMRHKFQQDKELARHLLAIMRVGDRLVFRNAGEVVTVWKRYRQITPEFDLEVAELQGIGKSLSAWPQEKGAISVDLQIGDTPLADLAFGLHRARNPYPLVDLESGQLARDGETIFRSAADGELTLVGLGGKDLQMTGVDKEMFGNVTICRLAAADQPIKVTWSQVPDRLLVVSDTHVALVDPRSNTVLQIREKRLQPLVANRVVKELVRLSQGPDYRGWLRQKFTATGPFAGTIDLSRDEIGPQDKYGLYQRVWLIRFADASGITQRQQRVDYQVSDRIKQNGSGKFLRGGK